MQLKEHGNGPMNLSGAFQSGQEGNLMIRGNVRTVWRLEDLEPPGMTSSVK